MTQQHIILIADPKVLAIPVKDNAEPMVDLNTQTKIVVGPSPDITNNTDYTKMRKTVYEKLIDAQTLLTKGVFFCLYEAYRSLTLQQPLFENRFRLIQSHHPEWTSFLRSVEMIHPRTARRL